MSKDWKRVGAFVRARRKELRLTQPEVASQGGPSPALQRQVEGGRYDAEMQAAMRRGYERALRWDVGSIDLVLDGGDPIPAVNSSEVAGPIQDRPREEQLFGLWDSAYADLLRYEDEYARLRGIARSDAFDELHEVWRMWHDVLDGRPWTPPWVEADEDFVLMFGEGATPWLRSWWAEQEMTSDPWVTRRMMQLRMRAAVEASARDPRDRDDYELAAYEEDTPIEDEQGHDEHP